MNKEIELKIDKDIKKAYRKYNRNELLNKNTNESISLGHLSKLHRTKSGIKVGYDERLDTLNKLLTSNNNEVVNHYNDLLDKLYDAADNDRRYSLIYSDVEHPLETMASYMMVTTNTDEYLRRHYYDGQERKRKDGEKYTRKFNIITEADMVSEDEQGNDISPFEMVGKDDTYLNDINYLIEDIDKAIQLTDNEKKVLACRYYGFTIENMIKILPSTKRKIETIDKHLRYKLLIYLRLSGHPEYEAYLEKCTNKYKNFDEDFNKYFQKNVKNN